MNGLGQAKAAQNRCHLRACWKICCQSEVPSTQVLLSPKRKEKKAQRGSVICPTLHSKVKGSPGLHFMNIEGEHL